PASIAPVSIAPAAPASIAPAARVRHEARLVTQTHMKVGVKPLLAEAQESLDDVWTRAGQVEAQSRPRTVAKKAEPKTIPPPLPAAARAPASAVRSTIDDISHATEQHPRSAEFEAIEISARARGALVDIAVLRNEGEQYVLGHKTPQGRVAPSTVHAGLRMARINADRTVDLVFPKEAAGHLVRGRETVMFSELSEGRKYSCLRLETRDIATLILGEGQHAISYHIRFIRRGAR
ncbi:hypothetical protein L6R52_44390, partial [Myxococcota bacterium]|nr:hypothetical protein [Myxococcota bacterium]